MKQIFHRVIGLVVNVIGWSTRPPQIKRTEQQRKALAPLVKGLRIYDYKGCPRSLKLRNELHRLNLDIQYCDIRKCQVHQDNLLAQFGRLQAPCLRIEENHRITWLDEPDQILHYLQQRFDTPTPRSLHA
jgi:glutaredoxin